MRKTYKKLPLFSGNTCMSLEQQNSSALFLWGDKHGSLYKYFSLVCSFFKTLNNFYCRSTALSISGIRLFPRMPLAVW